MAAPALRRPAGGPAAADEAASAPPRTDAHAQLLKLVHDLQVHQVELQAQNEALRAAQVELMRGVAVFNHSYDGIVVCDGRGIIVDVNPAFSRITGYARDEALGRTPGMLRSDQHDDAFYADIWRFLQAQDFWSGEIAGRRKSGSVYPQRLSIAAVRDGTSVTSYVAVFSDISEIKLHEAELVRVANYDPLTGLPNRRLFADRFALAVARARRSGRPLAVCYLDLDDFKQVNDRLGHDAGDRLLLAVAHSLGQVVRAEDTVARLGGDEFALLLDLDDAPQCEAAIARVMAAVNATAVPGAVPVRVSASLGVTLFPGDDNDPETLLRHADQAMYAAKEHGGSRVQHFDAQHAREVQAAQTLRSHLREALERDELVLHFQPKVDLKDGRILGAEALVRWCDPRRGLMLPASFLHALVEGELAVELGEWVLASTLRQLQAWSGQGLDWTASVNISPDHLLRPDFAERLRHLLSQQPGIDPRRLELEILESTAIREIGNAGQALHRCRELGVTVSLDDFGTGYSSLALLRTLPVDALKIDQSFVRGMLSDRNDLALVEGVVRLAETFHLQVVAEGVETIAQGAALVSIGCTRCQGYAIARPMPADELPAWMRRWQRDAPWQRLVP